MEPLMRLSHVVAFLMLTQLPARNAVAAPMPPAMQRNWVVAVNPGANCTKEELPQVKVALAAFAPDAVVLDASPAGVPLADWAAELRALNSHPKLIPLPPNDPAKPARLPDPSIYHFPETVAIPDDTTETLDLSAPQKNAPMLIHTGDLRKGYGHLGESWYWGRLIAQLAVQIDAHPQQWQLVFSNGSVPKLEERLTSWEREFHYQRRNDKNPKNIRGPLFFNIAGLPTHTPARQLTKNSTPLIHLLSERDGAMYWESFPVDDMPPVWTRIVQKADNAKPDYSSPIDIQRQLPDDQQINGPPPWLEEVLLRSEQCVDWQRRDMSDPRSYFDWSVGQQSHLRAFPASIRQKNFHYDHAQMERPWNEKEVLPADAVLSPASSLCILPGYSNEDGLGGDSDADYSMDIIDTWNKRLFRLFGNGPGGFWPRSSFWVTDRYLCLFGPVGAYHYYGASGDPKVPYYYGNAPCVRIYDFLTGQSHDAVGPPGAHGGSTSLASPPFLGLRSIDPKDNREIWKTVFEACRKSLEEPKDEPARLSVAEAWALVQNADKTQNPEPAPTATQWQDWGVFPRLEVWHTMKTDSVGRDPMREWIAPAGYGLHDASYFRNELKDPALYATPASEYDASLPVSRLWLKNGAIAAPLFEINVGSAPYPQLAVRPKENLLLVVGQRWPNRRQSDAPHWWMLLLDLKTHRGWWAE